MILDKKLEFGEIDVGGSSVTDVVSDVLDFGIPSTSPAVAGASTARYGSVPGQRFLVQITEDLQNETDTGSEDCTFQIVIETSSVENFASDVSEVYRSQTFTVTSDTDFVTGEFMINGAISSPQLKRYARMKFDFTSSYDLDSGKLKGWLTLDTDTNDFGDSAGKLAVGGKR